ncbi:ChaN family lipoprotein [Mucilaginibacter sp.]
MQLKHYLLLFLAALPCCLVAQPHYKLYSVADKKTVSPADIISRINQADILFFGEEHNDTVGHHIELKLWQQLAAQYPAKAALSLEMFETDCQEVLNEYLNGRIPEKYLFSDARAWPNYKTDYSPMVEVAKAARLPVLAANAPGRYVNMVNRQGLAALQLLSPVAKAFLPPLPIDTAAGAYYNKFSELMGGHGSMGGMQLYQAQNVWDAAMGWSLAQFYAARPGSKIMHINGGFHSEEKLGVVAQLKQYAPKLKVVTIACYASPDEFNQPNWQKYLKMADYIIITDFADRQ